MDVHADVLEFHRRFNVPVSTVPRLLRPDEYKYRLEFLLEELNEFRAAHERGDLAEAADGLVDLIYVAAGTALWMGLDLRAHWRAVQRANMLKVPVARAGDSKRQHPHDVVKPAGWVPPDHRQIILDTEASGT